VNLRLHLPVAGFVLLPVWWLVVGWGASNLRGAGQGPSAATPAGGRICFCGRFGGWSSVGGLPTFGRRVNLRLHLPVAGWVSAVTPAGRRMGFGGYTWRWPDGFRRLHVPGAGWVLAVTCALGRMIVGGCVGAGGFMIHTNRGGTDYEFGFSLNSDLPVSNPQFATGNTILGLVETWGNAFAPGSMGLEILVTNTAGSPDNYRIQGITPWFSYDSGVITGWVAAGSYFFLMQGAQLTVQSDCSWTLTFTGLQLWGATNGGASTLLDSCGAQTMSGTGYDERLNCSSMAPAMARPTLPPTYTCSTLASTTGSWAAGCSQIGGYRYKVGGSWFADPVSFDSSAPSSSCACSASLPGLTGSDSWTVGVGVSISGSVGVTTGSVACPGCTPSSWPFETQDSTFSSWFTSVTVKGRAPNLRSQTVALAWDCDLNAVISSGSSSTTASTAQTTCASLRGVTIANQSISCATAKAPICPPPPDGCGSLPAAFDCIYDGSSQLSWPTAPSCMAPLSNALGYDVSGFGEHVVAVAESGTGHIVLGVAGDVLPQSWSYMDSGLTGTWARPRYQDLGLWPVGLFYGDGTNCYWAQTFDSGATWVNTTSMASGVVGDFDEGLDGLRWFFKLVPGSGSTYDVWNQVLDAQLNVVRGWTITNVTGVDDAPIACRESAGSDGSWRIGLWYSVGGVANVKFAPDGLNFS